MKTNLFTFDLCLCSLFIFLLFGISINGKAQVRSKQDSTALIEKSLGVEYLAIEMSGNTDMSELSFTGSIENESLQLVKGTNVSVTSSIGSQTKAGEIWQTTSNGIYYTGGNVGIGTINPTAFVDIAKNTNYVWTASIYNAGGSSKGLLITNGYHGDLNGVIMQLCNTDENTPVMKVYSQGNVCIGTETPSGKLTVAGDISAQEIRVEASAGGADFVFADDYRLLPLQEVEQFIIENKHLPDIAPADSMIQNGISVSEMQIKLLQKIEELTLYVIEQEKRNEKQQNLIDRQQEQIQLLLDTIIDNNAK